MKRCRVTVTEAITGSSDIVPHLSGAEFSGVHGASVYIEKIMELGILKVEISLVSPFDRKEGE